MPLSLGEAAGFIGSALVQEPSTEDGPTASWNPRAASEAAVKELTARGVNTSVVRLAQVHDTRKPRSRPVSRAA
jgi:hypothetical protein